MVDEAKLTELENKLKDSLFLNGNAPGNLDADTLELFQKEKFVPCQEKNPNVWAWYALVVLFEDEVVKTWKKQTEKEKHYKLVKKGGEKKEKKEETKDDDFDPFAEETEEDKENLAKMKKESKPKDKKKKKEVEKSMVLLDIKGFESDQDLDALAQKIIKEIKMPGLSWKTEYKLQEVAFGIKKIHIGLIVEDEICSVDDVVEKIEAYEDEVQSVEIVAFNKL